MGRRDSEAPASSVDAAGRVVPGGCGGGGGGGGGGDASFDTNVVIILAAIFFALLFAIGLNSLARCALRYGGSRGAGGGGGEGASRARAGGACGAGGGGIKRRVLRSLAVEVYGGGKGIDDVCAICLGEFVDGEKVRVLPRCGHGFHVRCIDAWLVSHGSCPTCRRPVMDSVPAAPAKDGSGAAVGRSRRPESDTIAVVIV